MNGTAPVLEAKDVSLRFGGIRALSEVSFSVDRGELFSIIGPNGAGKTSMLNCVSGRYTPTEGSIHFLAATFPASSRTSARRWGSAEPSKILPCSAT